MCFHPTVSTAVEHKHLVMPTVADSIYLITFKENPIGIASALHSELVRKGASRSSIYLRHGQLGIWMVSLVLQSDTSLAPGASRSQPVVKAEEEAQVAPGMLRGCSECGIPEKSSWRGSQEYVWLQQADFDLVQ